MMNCATMWWKLIVVELWWEWFVIASNFKLPFSTYHPIPPKGFKKLLLTKNKIVALLLLLVVQTHNPTKLCACCGHTSKQYVHISRMTQGLKVNNNDMLPKLASTTQTSLPHLFSFFWWHSKKKKPHFVCDWKCGAKKRN